MVDFAKLLKEQRLKEKMDKAIPKPKPASMIPAPREKVEEPPPPDIREIDISNIDRLKVVRLVSQHSALGLQERDARNNKKALTNQLKGIVKNFDTKLFLCDGNRVNYYSTSQAVISKELLLSNGVSPAVIAASTVTKDKWTLRITPPGMKEETNGDEE